MHKTIILCQYVSRAISHIVDIFFQGLWTPNNWGRGRRGRYREPTGNSRQRATPVWHRRTAAAGRYPFLNDFICSQFNHFNIYNKSTRVLGFFVNITCKANTSISILRKKLVYCMTFIHIFCLIFGKYVF